MYAKKQVDKFILEKQEQTYLFSWYFQDELVWSEIRQYSEPNEEPNIEDIVNHKKECCFIIDNLEIIKR